MYVKYLKIYLTARKNSIPLSKNGICRKTSGIHDSEAILLHPNLFFYKGCNYNSEDDMS
jgi:hypothetical protein